MILSNLSGITTGNIQTEVCSSSLDCPPTHFENEDVTKSVKKKGLLKSQRMQGSAGLRLLILPPQRSGRRVLPLSFPTGSPHACLPAGRGRSVPDARLEGEGFEPPASSLSTDNQAHLGLCADL